MPKRPFYIVLLSIIILISLFLFQNLISKEKNSLATNENNENIFGGILDNNPHNLSIEYLRKQNYPGSDLKIEQTLEPGSNYSRHIVSYLSEGLKIYALLTIPKADPPKDGFPAIVFNHGYIPPAQYKTTEKYIAYTDAFSRNGYVLLRPDYRWHGSSEGEATGAYGSNAYAIDILNALSSLKKHKSVNPNRIGMWGHSLGGFITLRAMVVSKDIKAGVIWAGVVGSYEDLFERWRRRNAPSATPSTRGGSWRQALSQQFGEPSQNPTFWNSISANSFLSDISGPLQLHHGTADSSVPVEFSEKLAQQLKDVGKIVELYTYSGDDHNISANFGTAARRSVEFFDKYLK